MRLILGFTVLLAVSSAFAETTLYRWVDAQGNVHYSDTTPPKGVAAEKITVQDKNINTLPADKRQVQEMQAEQRRQQMYQSRALDDWQRRYKAAQQELQAAREQLKQAQKIGEGDTVGSFMGGARPTEAWNNRLEAAKKNLQEKQQAVDKLEAEKNHLIFSN